MSEQPLPIPSGYFDLAVAVMARAADSVERYVVNTQTKTQQSHLREENPCASWAWLTCRGRAARLPAALIYEACDIEPEPFLRKLWQRYIAIDAQKMQELEDAITEECQYDFTGRLSRQAGNFAQHVERLYRVASPVSDAVRDQEHAALVPSERSGVPA